LLSLIIFITSIKYERIIFACEDSLTSRLTEACNELNITLIDEVEDKQNQNDATYYYIHGSNGVSVKLLRALILNYVIVTIDFAENLCSKLRDQNDIQKALPDSSQFTPNDISNCNQTADRKQLFTGVSFVFFQHDLFEEYASLLKLANATVHYSDATLDGLENFLSKYSKSILISSERNVSQNDFFSTLDELGFQFISDKQLITCILTCSTDGLPRQFPSDAYNKYKEKVNRERSRKEEEAKKKREQEEQSERMRKQQEQKAQQLARVKLEDEQQQEEPEVEKQQVVKTEDMEVEDTPVVSRRGKKRVRDQTNSQTEGSESQPKKVKLDEQPASTECFITVEYVDLISVKSEEPSISTSSSYVGGTQSSGYNAKKFRKAKVGLSAVNSQPRESQSSISASNVEKISVEYSHSNSDKNSSPKTSEFDTPKSVSSQRSQKLPATSPPIATKTPATTTTTTPHVDENLLPVMTFEVEDDAEEDADYQARLQKIFDSQKNDSDDDDDDDVALDLLNADVDTDSKKKKKTTTRSKKK
jgi:hypothetical protein